MAPIDIASNGEFDLLLERLAKDVVDLEIFRRLRADLDAARAEFSTEFAQSRAFWSLTFQALIEAVFFRLSRIYDGHDQSLSLLRWLETIQHNLELIQTGEMDEVPFDLQQLSIDIESVSDSDPVVKKLIQLRGNCIAHVNAEAIAKGKGLEKRFGLSPDEVNLLVERAATLLNRYGAILRRTVWSTQIVGHDDFRTVLIAMRSYCKKYETEIEEEFSRLTQAT
ncbi:MAG TPA: hypothetical protein VIB39_20935 [Candidatus Angelobacter sp.]|jgi:hypothetical protein